MAYKTSKKCFFCGEDTLSQKRIGKKTICENCENDLYELLGLRYFQIRDEPDDYDD